MKCEKCGLKLDIECLEIPPDEQPKAIFTASSGHRVGVTVVDSLEGNTKEYRVEILEKDGSLGRECTYINNSTQGEFPLLNGDSDEIEELVDTINRRIDATSDPFKLFTSDFIDSRS
ncbi:hypothetical protein ACFL0F_01645 [Patescibacteria group bacterium]